jgi:hypothetical protein
MDRTCWNCQLQNVCRLHHAVNLAIKENLGMVNVDAQAGGDSWIKVFGPLARACRQYKETPP